MNPLERFSRACIVPVVVLDNVEDAVPTAKALLAGGIDVMEITFRTAAAKDSIAAVAAACPDMLVGAGTVINLEQCKAAVSAGAGFVVAITGSIMTMPGLPKVPAANNIDVTNDGVITGLF